VTIGVLAVQGNFREHAAMLRRLGANVVEVRLPALVWGEREVRVAEDGETLPTDGSGRE